MWQKLNHFLELLRFIGQGYTENKFKKKFDGETHFKPHFAPSPFSEL